ncbi:MAG: TetR/AcrR family transcriptional regulator [Oliverpabstia sp.]
MNKKENQRIALTKRLLKENLLKLLEKKTIQKISVSELCEASGINRSTFYNHYGSPYDVLKEMELDVIEDLNDLWERCGAGRNWPLEKRVETLCSYLREHSALTKMLLRSSDSESEFALMLFNATHIRSIYEEIFSDIADINSRRMMITFLTNGTYHMLRQWTLEDMTKSPKEMGELFRQIANHDWDICRH